MSDVGNGTKTRALIGLGAALVVTLGLWVFINRQTSSGVARLERMDTAWTVCKTKYAVAQNAGDTSAIDVSPLSAAIDSGKAGAPRHCGDLRRPENLEARKDSMNRAATRPEMAMPGRTR